MRICLVTTELLGVAGLSDAAFAVNGFVKHLSQQAELDILLIQEPAAANNSDFKIWQREYKKMGIGLRGLEFPRFEIETPFLFFAHSYLAYLNLKESKYDIIFFLDRGGLAYHCLLAKNLQLAFQTTTLVTLYTDSLGRIRPMEKDSNRYSELVRNYVEKKCLLFSDVVLFPTRAAEKVVSAKLAAKLRSSEVFYYPYDFGGSSLPQSNTIRNRLESGAQNHLDEICFVGTLDQKSELNKFLSAVSILKQENFLESKRVSLIEQSGKGLSKKAKRHLEQWMELSGVQLQVHADLGRAARITYLKSRTAMAVLFPGEDPAGMSLIGCLENGIPFICSDDPGLSEIGKYLKQGSKPVFRSGDPVELAAKIRDMSGQKQKAVKSVLSKNDHQDALVKILKRMTRARRARPNAAPAPITACIVFFDRPEFLRQNLMSLKPLGGLISEILVYVNRSSTKESKTFLKSLAADHRIRFVDGPQGLAPGHARNRMAAAAKTENLFFLDDDNFADAGTLKKLLECGVDDWDVLCSPLKRFDSEHFHLSQSSTSQQVLFKLENIIFAHWLPVGDDIALNILENKIGDCNFLAKRSHLLKVGGFNEALFYGEDQEFLVRSVYNGARYLLSPESFVFYRTHGSNLTKDVDHDQESFRLMQVILDGIRLQQFLPAFDLLRSSGFEVEKKAQFEQVRDIYNQSNYSDASEYDFAFFKDRIQKVFKNKLRSDAKSRLVECELIPRKGVGTMMKALPNRAVEVVFFSTSDVVASIFDSEVTLSKGYTIANIRYNAREKISIFSAKKASIYILKVRDALL
jgi:GT2 family glycosyltransferase